MFNINTHIFHVVLDPVLLQVGGRLCPVEPLSRIHVRLLKVIPVDLQLVVRVGAEVHCSGKNKNNVCQICRYVHF